MTKKLYRLPDEGKLTGLSAGLAQHFGTDVLLVRLLWVAAAIITNPLSALFLYFIIAFIVPAKNGVKGGLSSSFTEYASDFVKEVSEVLGRNKMRLSLGIVVIAIGVYLLLRSMLPELFNIRWDIIWPAVLVLIGAAILIRKGAK